MKVERVNGKIKSLDQLLHILNGLRNNGKRIVLSHGIFDVIHPGIIRHIESAKRQGDMLIVSVIKNKDVRRGPSRPIFDERLRAENVASLEYVDYVCLVDDDPPFECLKIIKPDVFAKGEDYRDRDPLISEILKHEEEAIRIAGCKVHFTSDSADVSSTHIINQFLDVYPEETRRYLKDLSKRYTTLQIVNYIRDLKDLRVLIVGDGIVDEYHYCESMGKSPKDHLVVSRYLYEETFAGGSFAVANHIAGLCQEVQLVTLLGRNDTRTDFILSKLKPNIKPKFFYREDAPTIIKRRFVHQYSGQKLFEVCYMNNENIPEECENQLCNYLASQIPSYDLVVIADFGHGILSKNLINLIEDNAKILAVNTQTNSANVGFNMVTKYKDIDYACLDESEVRLAFQDRYGGIDEIVMQVTRRVNAEFLITTLGARGSIGFSPENGFFKAPALATKVVDRIGAGDAFFAFTAPCFAKGMPLDLISFIGNAVGAIAVQIVCNRESVEPDKLIEFISALLR
jgi:rfaE bifunctional protein nucleotidyltransferase chain/domain